MAARRAPSPTEKIASFRADELQDRMLQLEERMGRRAEKLAQETGPMLKKLDKATRGLRDQRQRACRHKSRRRRRTRLPRRPAVDGIDTRPLQDREEHRAEHRTRHERAPGALRPALTTIRNDAPRLKEVAEKLQKIHHEHSKNTDDVNKAFSEFEEIVRSEDRKKIASRASIVIPWFIAVLITSIALARRVPELLPDRCKRPMAEIVGEGARIGGIGLPAFAAIIVIFLEFVTGVVLRGLGRLHQADPGLPLSMSEGGRRVMLGVSFCFLMALSVSGD